MRFAFNRRVTTECTVWVEAPSEREGWEHLHSGKSPDVVGDERLLRAPVFRRLPELDEFDL